MTDCRLSRKQGEKKEEKIIANIYAEYWKNNSQFVIFIVEKFLCLWIIDFEFFHSFV